MKNLLLVCALLISSQAFAKKNCFDNAASAALALEGINSKMKVKELTVENNDFLGSIMTLTGYLEKFQVVIAHTGNSKKGYYQMYLDQDTCVVNELKKVIPFEYQE